MKTLVALLAVACLVCTGEAFKQRKRQTEETDCCLPDKYAAKITTVTVDDWPNEDGEIESKKYTTTEYKIVDGFSNYRTTDLQIPGSLTYRRDGKEGHAWYSEFQKCYTSWVHDVVGAPFSSAECLNVAYVGNEEVDGVSYSVFRSSYSYDVSSNRSQVLLAHLDRNGRCWPSTWVNSEHHPHPDSRNSTHLTTVTTTYMFLELSSEEFESFLRQPSQSAYCPGEYPDSSADTTSSESGTSDSSNDEAVTEQASEKKKSHVQSRRSFAKTKRFGF